MVKTVNRTTPISAISNIRMHLFLWLYSLAGIKSGLPPPVGRIEPQGALWGWWRSRYRETVYCYDRGHTQPHRGVTLPARQWRGLPILRATMATSPLRGKGFGGAQWILLRELGHACIGFVQPAYLRQPSLVTDTMALCLQTAKGQRVGIATIYPIELSRGALSAVKDIGWAGRVNQLYSTILSAVMSQE